jgi:hypothetical protein
MGSLIKRARAADRTDAVDEEFSAAFSGVIAFCAMEVVPARAYANVLTSSQCRGGSRWPQSPHFFHRYTKRW